MSYWVAEKSYNKVTTGKWHGNEPRPKGAPKPKPKPTLVKSRVRLRTLACLAEPALPWRAATVALSARGCSRLRSTTQSAERALWTTRTTRSRACRRQRSRHGLHAVRGSTVSLLKLTHAHDQAMVAKEAPAGDAFEGMTPEEINDYLQREKAERQAQVEAEEAEAAEAARTT